MWIFILASDIVACVTVYGGWAIGCTHFGVCQEEMCNTFGLLDACRF